MNDNRKKGLTGRRIVTGMSLLWGLLLIIYLVSLVGQDSVLLAIIMAPPIIFIVLLGVALFLDFVLG